MGDAPSGREESTPCEMRLKTTEHVPDQTPIAKTYWLEKGCAQQRSRLLPPIQQPEEKAAKEDRPTDARANDQASFANKAPEQECHAVQPPSTPKGSNIFTRHAAKVSSSQLESDDGIPTR